MGEYKMRRKLSKYQQRLKLELRIDSSDKPSKHLMVCNAGLVSGTQYERLAQLFTKYGPVERIVMIPRKSYSFVSFSALDEAMKAYEVINGRVTLENMDGPLFLLYVASVPEDSEYLPNQESLPEGLTLLKDFVTSEEEEQLLNCVTWGTEDQETGKTLKHRRVKHFGYEFRYDINNVDKDSPLDESIPAECEFISGRLERLGHPLSWEPDQLTVNQYQRGQGIPSHVDTHSAFESPLLSLSLGSDVVMEFRRGSELRPVLLPRRSLLIMDGEARYAWSHGITPRTMDVVHVARGLTVQERGCRTSFTLRRVRRGPCDCAFLDQCDSQRPQVSEDRAGLLEELYVHKVYSNIAAHFSETRTKIWPNVEEFLSSFPPGSVVVDAGCGNGKYFGVNPRVFQMGFDRSVGLVEITRDRGHQVFVADCLSLPLRPSCADGLISVAVLHHLSTRARRLRALREISRVLAPGGRALVTVWAKDQTRRDLTAYLKQDRKNRRKNPMSETDGMQPNKSAPRTKTLSDQELSVQFESKATTTPTRNSESKDIPTPVSPSTTPHTDPITPEDFKLPVHVARTEFQHQDVFVPWKVKSKDLDDTKPVYLRYYHVFEENELQRLCSEVDGIRVLETYYTEGNWCVIIEKVA